MNLFSRLIDRFKDRRAALDELRAQHAALAAAVSEFKTAFRIPDMLIPSDSGLSTHPPFPNNKLELYTPPADVIPPGRKLSFDNAISSLYTNAIMFTGVGFPGFPYLMELAQITEYRDISERTAKEMTRKWIKLRSKSGKEDQTERIAKISDEMDRLEVRDFFRSAAIQEGLYGRSQLYMRLEGASENSIELKSPLLRRPEKITKGALKELVLVEPINTYPADYSATDALNPNYFKPRSWFVLAREVHDSRMLTFVSRPLPNLLKPAYNFSGISMSQLAMPYVKYWLDTRGSVGRLLTNFSCSVLATNLQDTLAAGPDGSQLIKRVQLYNKLRNNQGMLVLDRDTENFMQVNTPLSGLNLLQAQSQEHMAAVAKTPLVVLLGVTPTGLNASSEGEIRIYYDYIADMQDALFRKNLQILLEVIQLSLFGDVDKDITFDFISLMEPSEAEKSSMESSKVDRAVKLITAQVISPLEERKRLAVDPNSGYDGLEAEKLPEPSVSASKPDVKKETTASPEGSELDSGKETLEDGVKFFGNQHTGLLAQRDDSPYAMSIKASAAAQHATRVANTTHTSRNHAKAKDAHQRAINLHREALTGASPEYVNIHKAYIEAHRALIAQHEKVLQGRRA